MIRVGVLDLGTGNLFSVLKGLERAGARPTLVTTAQEILSFARLILPGVGSFADAMRRAAPLRGALGEAVEAGTSLLGICLGMQLLFEEGEEDGATAGLGLIPGRVRRLEGGPGLIVPHVGWQRIRPREDTPLLPPEGGWFYFSHSYRALTPERFVAASVWHGEEIPALVRRGRVWGIQPHPEKSGRAGAAFLKSFLETT